MKYAAPFALLAALSLVGCAPEVAQTDSNAIDATPVSASADPAYAEGDLVVSVPKMHCPYACWPKVEETLAAQPGVKEVKLSQQKDETAIDNPVVYVSTGEGFDADAAMGELAEAGFDESTISETH